MILCMPAVWLQRHHAGAKFSQTLIAAFINYFLNTKEESSERLLRC